MQGRALSDAEIAHERARLAALALTLVHEEGREACSLRRVAELAGISRSTPYRYFADKEALLDAARVAALDRLTEGCAAAMAGADGVAARLAAVGRAYVAFALGHPNLYDLIFEPCLRGPEHLAAVARYQALALAPLQEAAEQGLLVLPPERLAQALWAATHGALALHRAGKLQVDLQTALSDLGDTLAFGFTPRGSAS